MSSRGNVGATLNIRGARVKARHVFARRTRTVQLARERTAENQGKKTSVYNGDQNATTQATLGKAPTGPISETDEVHAWGL